MVKRCPRNKSPRHHRVYLSNAFFSINLAVHATSDTPYTMFSLFFALLGSVQAQDLQNGTAASQPYQSFSGSP